MASLAERSRRLLGFAATVLMILITTLVFVAVIFRFFLNLPLSGIDEIIVLLFVWLTFAGSAAAVDQGAHIALQALSGILPERATEALQALVALAVAAFGLFLLAYGWEYDQVAFTEVLPETGIPLGWEYLAIPLGGAVMVLFGVGQAGHHLLRFMGPPSLPERERPGADDGDRYVI